MTDEPEVIPDEEEEVEEYEPRQCILGDGDVLIDDPVELFEMTGSIALQVRDGALFALKRETMKWVNVEDVLKQRGPTIVQAVRTKQ